MQLSSENETSSSTSSAAGDGANCRCLHFKNINGADIELQIITHQPSVCQEFVITSPKLSFNRWLLSTAVFYALACALQLHVQDIRFLATVTTVVFVVVIIKVCFKVSKESLLVVSSVGVQLTTTFATGRQTTRFYDMSDVNAIFINEAVSMYRVIFYLAILLGQPPAVNQRLVPLFTNCWPRLACLTQIYQEVDCLLPKTVMPDDEQSNS